MRRSVRRTDIERVAGGPLAAPRPSGRRPVPIAAAAAARRWALRALDAVPGRLAREWKGMADTTVAGMLDARAPDGEPPQPVVTAALHARLSARQASAARSAALAADRGVWEAASEADRLAVELHCAIDRDIEGIPQSIGLTNARPPESVHHSAQGPLAAGGALRIADLVADALAASGSPIRAGTRLLDFGCSSGRVVAPLQAAFPDAAWFGCDPNRDAIAWAAAALPAVRFTSSPTDPPLPYGPGAFDAAFAISIWSHLAPAAATRWLDEMLRILEPGGRLLLTTHGIASIAHFAHARKCAPSMVLDIARRLYADGTWFRGDFGQEGDWGVRHAEWGTAFYSPEWMLRALGGRWSVEHFRAGGLEHNQDVYVLAAKPGWAPAGGRDRPHARRADDSPLTAAGRSPIP